MEIELTTSHVYSPCATISVCIFYNYVCGMWNHLLNILYENIQIFHSKEWEMYSQSSCLKLNKCVIFFIIYNYRVANTKTAVKPVSSNSSGSSGSSGCNGSSEFYVPIYDVMCVYISFIPSRCIPHVAW